MLTKPNITVVDNIMGGFKTTWAIRQMANPALRFVYVTPYLDEIERIKNKLKEYGRYNVYTPKNLGKGKGDNLAQLLTKGNDVIITHRLFEMADEKIISLLQDKGYTLFIDEALQAIEPFEYNEQDIEMLTEAGFIHVDEHDRIIWDVPKYNTSSMSYIKNLADAKSLVSAEIRSKNGKTSSSLVWFYPPEIFYAFEQIYILTYRFQFSIMASYFKLCGLDYETKSVLHDDTDGTCKLVDYFEPDLTPYRERIHILDNKRMNFEGKQKANSFLSANYCKNPVNNPALNQVKKNAVNYVINKRQAKGKDVMWTCFKASKPKLKGSGYANSFVACNCRGTNQYKDRTTLLYLCNLFPHVAITSYLSSNGIEFDWKQYALNELIQWMWRSAIRDKDGGDIYIYIPSKRMRNLLEDWLGHTD